MSPARPVLLRSMLIVALSALSSTVHADTIHLANGKQLVGKVSEEADGYVIRLGGGTVVRLPKKDVVRVEPGLTPAETLVERESRLTPGDADAVYRLARWCKSEQLGKEASRLTWRTLEIDPNHTRARADLKFRKVGAVWLTEADYQRSLGKLFFEGKWRTPTEHARAVKAAKTRDLIASSQSLFRTAAGTGKEAHRSSALAQFREQPKPVRAWTLLKALDSLRSRDRQFAVRELGELGDPRYRRQLCHVAITDSKRSVRDESIAVLKAWQNDDTVLSFLPYLSSDNDRYRTNAARAINHFPDRRAAGTLIRTAHFIWAGFGRVHIASVTQRAFVKDYELVSGGTGLVVQEVADPVVDTFQEGVVLDISVRKAEAFARAAALQSITGMKFGTDFEQWASWWKEETGRVAAAAAEADAEANEPRATGEETHTGRG